MSDLLLRIQVLLGAAVTWFVALSTGLTAAAGSIAELAPEGSEPVVAWLLRAAAWLVVAWQVVRRVSPVLPAARGLLPVALPERSASLREEVRMESDPFWPGKSE
jgi:hypothetical protein